eukprot:TRINITY_DN1879_c0_g4_i2.p1 TRINITY_DN1879_c0_g4~~TRINITY_DN1879_c0_g4_i2.p1  ORF type:complete len:530 (-),score=75.72 TRINITY_DN1879_c0_g4_i2:28-1617(-)
MCWPVFNEIIENRKSLSSFNFSFVDVINFIVNQSSKKSKPSVVVLHIDEVNCLARRCKERLDNLFQTIGRSVFSLTQDHIFMFVITTGTGPRNTLEETLNADLSSFRPIFLHLSVLKPKEVEDKIFKNWVSKFDTSQWWKRDSAKLFLRLIRMVATLPRAIHLLLIMMTKYKNQKHLTDEHAFVPFLKDIEVHDYSALFSHLVESVLGLYELDSIPNEISKLVAVLSLGGITISPQFKIGGKTLPDLEKDYGILVSYSEILKPTFAKLDLPLVLLHAMLEKQNIKIPWLIQPNLLNGLAFEEVDGLHEVYRSLGFIQSGSTKLPLSRFYEGAYGDNKLLKHNIKLPQERFIEFHRSLKKFCHPLPDDKDEDLVDFRKKHLECEDGKEIDWIRGYIIATSPSSSTGDIFRVLPADGFYFFVFKQHKYPKKQIPSLKQNDPRFREQKEKKIRKFQNLIKNEREKALKTFNYIVNIAKLDKERFRFLFIMATNRPGIELKDLSVKTEDTLVFVKKYAKIFYSRAFWYALRPI